MTEVQPIRRRRFSLGPALMAALMLAALVPALLVSWLLSSNSSRAIETLAENALSQAAHRVDVGALAHLGESHTVVNALVPPVATSGAEGERTRRWLEDPESFEVMAYALTQQSPNVPYLYFGTQDGSFFGLEREDKGFVVRTIRPGDSGRRHYLIGAPGDRSLLIKTETTIYDPRMRPWYKLAESTGQRVFTNVYRSAVKNQFDLTLAHPIYGSDQKTLLGVMAVDMSLARLTDLIRSTRISENAVTYLVDAQGLMVATSVDEDLNFQVDGKFQRIKPEQSKDPLVNASYRLFKDRISSDTPGLMRMETNRDWLQRLGLSNNRLIAMQRPFGQKYQLNWQLIVVAPERDFTHQVTRARQWALAAMAGLIGVSALVAFVIGRRLSDQFRLLNRSAQHLGSGAVPPTQQGTRFSEVHNLSQVMHESAVKLQDYHTEVEHKNEALREAAQLLEGRVAQRTAELAASREEALAAVKAKAGFLAVMSHEIRTPLHGVVGMSELLTESPLTPTQRDLLGVLKVSSDQLLSVVDDILDFSKLESGKLELEDEALDVRATIGQVSDMVGLKAREKGLALVLDVAADVPVAIRGDVTRLRQVLLNLLSNAIKFTEQGQVALQVHTAGSAELPTLSFSITDTGLGIQPERIPELFQPFAQGDTSITRVYGGTGLGLMICKHLVGLMGGDIGVQSTLGVGSIFHFSVRAQPAELAEVPVPRHVPPPHCAHRERVLVVDDHPVNLKVAAAMLTRLGYPHVSASGGAEALQAIETAEATGQPFSAVLLDHHMPVMNGLDTARAIVQRWGAQAPALLGMSASNLGADREHALAAGMREHLPKPLELERLARALREWCAPPEGDDAVTANDTVAPEAPALDPVRWQSLAEYDDATGSLRRDIAHDFQVALAGRLSDLERAAAGGDTVALENAAHRMRGAAENLGLQVLGTLCHRLEDSAQRQQVDREAWAGLRAAADAAMRALDDALNALPSA